MFFITTMFIDKGELQHSRCVGYYKEKNVAVNAVQTNNADIYEYTYNYAVIEHLEEGIYPYDVEPIFFKWNDDKQTYDKVERPKELKNSYGFGIG